MWSAESVCGRSGWLNGESTRRNTMSGELRERGEWKDSLPDWTCTELHFLPLPVKRRMKTSFHSRTVFSVMLFSSFNEINSPVLIELMQVFKLNFGEATSIVLKQFLLSTHLNPTRSCKQFFKGTTVGILNLEAWQNGFAGSQYYTESSSSGMCK